MNLEQFVLAVREVPPEPVLAAAARLWDGVLDRGWRGMHNLPLLPAGLTALSHGLVVACGSCREPVKLGMAGVFLWGRCVRCGVFWWT